jgi:hypothetical protein
MKSILAKFLIFLTLASSLGSVDLLAKPAFGNRENLVSEPAHEAHNQQSESKSEPDCDTETCAQHQCHLGHCQFSISSSVDVATPMVSGLQMLTTSDRMNPFDYLSSLIKPPCV